VIAKLAFYVWTIATKDSFTLVIADYGTALVAVVLAAWVIRPSGPDARRVVDHGRGGGRGRGPGSSSGPAWHPTSTSTTTTSSMWCRWPRCILLYRAACFCATWQ